LISPSPYPLSSQNIAATSGDVISSLHEPVSLRGLRLFPNPASEGVWLEAPQAVEARLSLFNAQGVRLHQELFSGQRRYLPLQGLPVGPYWIHILTAEGQAVRRVVKY
jgi:hypothetical protein